MVQNELRKSKSMNKWQEFAGSKPITVLIIIAFLCLVLRIIDTFVLPVAVLVGELIISKALGFILIVIYLWSINQRLNAIGIYKRNAGKAVVIGCSVVAIMLVMYYSVILIVTSSSGVEGSLKFVPTDPKTGKEGDFYFALWLIFGNIVNVFMEEGLFRGLMTRKFLDRMSFWKTNFLQAFLFGIWHITWPIKDFLDGDLSFGGLIMQSIMATFSALLVGLIWGYMYFKTASLFASLLCHYFFNSTLNLIAFVSTSGQENIVDNAVTLAGAIALLVGLLSIYLIKLLAERWNLPQLQPWSAGEFIIGT
ncbi:MAG: CPBP family intramembrane glutamic endopeptidase [Candidatus Hodarchaeota archaeon]